MNLTSKLKSIEANHHPRWLILLRALLGLALFLRGIQFIRDQSLLVKAVESSSSLKSFVWLETVIPWVHLLGGVFILIGLFTRWAIIFQLPIVLGAIIFVNARDGIFVGSGELWFSILILILLVVFLVEGDGFLSWKKMLNKEKDIV